MTAQQRFLVTLLSCVGLAPLAACSADDDHDHASGPSSDQIAAWEDAYEQVELGKVDSSGCSGVVVPDSAGFQRRVALTFDDGPNPETTPQVLDTLKQYGVSATFFINGNRAGSDAAKSVLARILAEGHILANHSQQHLNLKNLSSAQVDSQVRLTHEVLVAAGESRFFFRFPFGSASCSAMNISKSYGYVITGWHVDSGDWCYAAATGGVGYCHPSTFRYVPDSFRADMVGYTLSQIRSKNGGIVLFHDIHQNTASNLDAIVSTLLSEGFTFVNVNDAATFPKLNGAAVAPSKFVGDSCADHADCTFSDGATAASCYTHGGGGFCTLPCEGFCPDQPGKAPTFCTSLDGGQTGSCVSKSASLNGQCASIPGTSATSVERFVGSSGAAATTAIACVPN